MHWFLLPAILYISMLKSSQSLYIVVVKMQWLCLKADSILLLGVSRFLRQTAESVFHLIRGTWNGNTQDLIPWHILQKILANALKFCSMIFLDFCCVNQISLFQMKACWFSLQREIFWLHVIAISTHGFTVLIPTTA